MSYKDVVTADLRLVTLKVAAAAPGYEVNSNILRMALEQYGHHVSSDRLKTEFGWLEEQGLLTVSAIGALQVARLTQRGRDVAEGRASVPGVARPEPEAGT